MTTTLFLVRHAPHGLLDRVMVGRMPGVPITEAARRAAERVAGRLRPERIALVQSSPQQRARETAEPIGQALGQTVEIAAALDEIDIGDWTGRSFDELREDPRWTMWNSARSIVRAPGGETFAEVQGRFVRHVEDCRRRHPEQGVVMVSHADVIKAGLLFFLGAPIDFYSRLEISPASISTLVVGDWGAKVLATNETVPA